MAHRAPGLGQSIALNFREGLIVDGEITDESFVSLLQDWAGKFADWIRLLKAPAQCPFWRV